MQKNSIPLPCTTCGLTFTVAAYRVANGTARYCSKPCADAGQRAHRIVLRCAADSCQNEFSVAPSTAARGKGKYCSKACQYASGRYNRPVERTCIMCGAKWMAHASTVAKWPAETCADCWRATFRTSEGYNGWEYRRWRAAVYERDAFTCQRCGRTDGSLHAHHVRFWTPYPESRYEISNGLTLCWRCHSRVHLEAKRLSLDIWPVP